MNNKERLQALQLAGYREKFAMQNGKATVKYMNGHKLIIFRYSSDADYQDANGATYDATRGAWIN